MRSFLRLSFTVTAALFLAAACLGLDYIKRNNLVLPRTVLGRTSLSAMTYEKAFNSVQQSVQSFMNESFSLVAYDQVAQATIKDLGSFNR